MAQTETDHDKILILDFGSQYTQLIARRIRELGIYSEIFPFDAPASSIENFNPKGVILSGGPDTVTDNEAGKAPEIIFALGIPILGICYGMQTLAVQLGGRARAAEKHEYGFAQIKCDDTDCRLFKDLKAENGGPGAQVLDVWMSHGIEVVEMPPGFKRIASTESCDIAGIANAKRHYYGLQFHPEVTHTEQGIHILNRFASGICDCRKSWTAEHIIERTIAELKRKIAARHVVLGLSGGVDSAVTAALLHRAVGAQLHCIFVDNGFLRLNEGDEVMHIFAENMGIDILRINAAESFYTALGDESEPERKRKIIGRRFIEIFEEEAGKLAHIDFLAQGTIYPDVIESAGGKNGKAKVIKSHHNVGGLPENLRLKLVEPLNLLFKDEVRKIGTMLGLPQNMLNRHPFPGPGLAVRIIGAVKKEYAQILQRVDDIYISELHNHNLYDKVSQAFAVFLPIKSVGVAGDVRRYGYVIALRAVETVDFMTAHFARLPVDFLDFVARRIMNEVPQIARVVYDISGKPPATIEWE